VVGTVATLVVVATSILLMLVRPSGIAEVWWIGGGALALVLLRLLCLRAAAGAVAKGADVYLFLAGMMLLSEVARSHGVFDWMASAAVRSARGSCVRLFTTLYAVGTVVTVFMSNDATAVVLTPAILVAVRKAKVDPLPHLFVCALIANAASFVLPISNPANLVVFRGDMPSLGHWLAAFLLPSALSIGTTYLVLRRIFRRNLELKLDANVEGVPLTAHGRWALGGIGIVAVVLLTASAFDVDLGLPTFVAAVVVSVTASVVARKNPLPLLREISWSTLVLVAGLFVLVEAVQSIGALDVMRSAVGWAASLPRWAGAFVLSFAVGVGNNVVNNLPLGLLVGATLESARPPSPLAHAALIGVDLGPNLAITGSLASILWLIALRREKLDVSFRAFFKVGAVVMPTALAAATLGSLLTSAVVAGDDAKTSPRPSPYAHDPRPRRSFSPERSATAPLADLRTRVRIASWSQSVEQGKTAARWLARGLRGGSEGQEIVMKYLHRLVLCVPLTMLASAACSDVETTPPLNAGAGTTIHGVVDLTQSPPPPPSRRGPAAEATLQPMTAKGTIQAILFNPEGLPDGLVLDDGTTAHVPPSTGIERLTLKVGDRVTITGRGSANAIGKGMRAETIALSNGAPVVVDAPPPVPTSVSVEGTVQRLFANPHGDVDLLLLSDGSAVRIPPMTSSAVAAKLRVGNTVHIEGDALGAALHATQVRLSSGEVIATEPGAPPPPPLDALPRVDDTSTIVRVLTGPRGEVDRIILADGTIAHVPRRLAEQAASNLAVGARLHVEGEGGRYALGTSLRADTLRLDSGQTFVDPGPMGPRRPPVGPGAPPPPPL
jgi:arsenical pump membrane protein